MIIFCEYIFPILTRNVDSLFVLITKNIESLIISNSDLFLISSWIGYVSIWIITCIIISIYLAIIISPCIIISREIFSKILKKDYRKFSVSYPEQKINYGKVFYFICLKLFFSAPITIIKVYNFSIDEPENITMRYLLDTIIYTPSEFLALNFFLQTSYKKNPITIISKEESDAR